jgi:hypothetical protein
MRDDQLQLRKKIQDSSGDKPCGRDGEIYFPFKYPGQIVILKQIVADGRQRW